MSDTGGPEDPEVAKLREQLAAAERVAAIRAEIESARDELAALESVDSTASSPAANRNSSVRQESDRSATREQTIWRGAAVLVTVGAIAAIVTLAIQRTPGDSGQATQRTPGDSKLAPEDPTLVLDCPTDRTSSTTIVRVAIGADWSWDEDVGFRSLVVNYGDGNSSGFVREANTNALSKALSHEYTEPGTYKIEAELYDTQGNKGQDSCTFVWTAKKTAASQATTASTTIPGDTRYVLKLAYEFGESSDRVKKLQQTINSVIGSEMSVDGVYGPNTRLLHLRALFQLDLTIKRVPDLTVPPKYELYKHSNGKGQRWGPCTGAVRVAFNPNGHLDSEETADWSTFIEDMTTEVAMITGINFSFVGQTSEVPASSYGDVYASSVDFLIFFGPRGTSTVLSADAGENLFGNYKMFYATGSSDPDWYEVIYAAIHVQTGTTDEFGNRPGWRGKNLMNYFARILGLGLLDASPPAAEIMQWGSNGSGAANSPKWGSGDKIGLERVGASNGCF